MINIEITLQQIREQAMIHFAVEQLVVHSAAITALTPEVNRVVIEGIVVYEYYDESMDEVIYMAFHFETANDEKAIQFIEPVDESEGGFDMLEEAEALFPFNSINIE